MSVDCGTPINPDIVRTQISGAAIMGHRRNAVRKHGARRRAGRPTPRSPTTRFPACTTFRPCRTLRFVPGRRNGPFGAKGVGESGIFAVSPAIANALDDAVGVRLTHLPLSPEAVLRALRAKDGRPIEDDE